MASKKPPDRDEEGRWRRLQVYALIANTIARILGLVIEH